MQVARAEEARAQVLATRPRIRVRDARGTKIEGQVVKAATVATRDESEIATTIDAEDLETTARGIDRGRGSDTTIVIVHGIRGMIRRGRTTGRDHRRQVGRGGIQRRTAARATRKGTDRTSRPTRRNRGSALTIASSRLEIEIES